jgi:hypothetical protein
MRQQYFEESFGKIKRDEMEKEKENEIVESYVPQKVKIVNIGQNFY